MDENQIFSSVAITLTEFASDKILHHIFSNPLNECGGYLIGSVYEQNNNISALIEDVFMINEIGSNASFKFSPQSGLDAYNYCLKCDAVNATKYKIIGNYHSHGSFQAFFSDIDEVMMRQTVAPEIYMVFSPSSYEFTALYKDKLFRLYMVDCDFDIPGFNYIPPYLNSKGGWKFYNTRVNFKELSRVSIRENIPQQDTYISRIGVREHGFLLSSNQSDNETLTQNENIQNYEQTIEKYFCSFKELYEKLQPYPNILGVLDFRKRKKILEIQNTAFNKIKQLRELMIYYGCLLSDKIKSRYLKCENIFSEIVDWIK